MRRFGLYARKSDKDRDEVIKSIADQKISCTEITDRLGCPVVKTYEENQSAKKPGIRPIYKQMVKDIKAGRINAIVTYHVNRLARNVEEGGALAQMLVDGKILEIRTPNAVYTPADNILPLLLEQGNATQFSRDLSRRMIDATAQTAAAGGWPRSAPIGYLTQRHPLYPKKTVVVEDPERFALVRHLFELAMAGTHSVQQIAEIASDDWGLTFRQTPTKPQRPLQRSAVNGILKNPFYAGMVRHKGNMFPGRHRAMLTAAEFARVQQFLGRANRSYRRVHCLTYTGLMRCGYCGLQVTGEQHVKGGRRYVYYRCSDSRRECTKRGIPEDALEQQIVGLLESVRIDAGVGRAVLECLMQREQERESAAKECAAQERASLKRIDEQRERLVDMLVSGLISDEELYRRKEETLLAERNRLMLRLAEREERGARAMQTARAGVSFLEQALSRFAVASPETKKAVCTALGFSYVLRGDELQVEMNPLLKEIVRFSGSIETTVKGSQSKDCEVFLTSCQFGVPKVSQVELLNSLDSLLTATEFYNPFDHGASTLPQ